MAVKIFAGRDLRRGRLLSGPRRLGQLAGRPHIFVISAEDARPLIAEVALLRSHAYCLRIITRAECGWRMHGIYLKIP